MSTHFFATCLDTFGVDSQAEELQFVPVARLLARAAQLEGAPLEVHAAQDRAYSELQGFGPYRAPLVPYPLQPSGHVILWGAVGAFDLGAVRDLLLQRYPPMHPVRVATLADDGTVAQRSETTVGALPAQQLSAPTGALMLYHLPPLAVSANLRGLDGLLWVVARLYGPSGCPWDRQQTHQSLRGALLEEAYEVLEALDQGDMVGLREELGDLLLAVVAQSEMARQAGLFAIDDVLEGIAAKLIRRHPHVFGDLAVSGTGEVLHNWEQIKAEELAAKGRSRTSALDGIPIGLPALASSEKLIKKARRAGFAWPDVASAWAKVDEELAELRAAVLANDAVHIAEEFGDLLFTLVELARWLHVDPEVAVRDSNAKFRRRFTLVEQAAQAQGRALNELSLAAMLDLWAQAKAADTQ